MATYIAHSASRDTVTLMFSKAEAEALLRLAATAYEECICQMNGQTKSAANRAMSALSAATNTSARRAGFFDV